MRLAPVPGHCGRTPTLRAARACGPLPALRKLEISSDIPALSRLGTGPHPRTALGRLLCRSVLGADHGDLVLRVDGDCLVGPPFGRVCLKAAPLPPQRHPPKPPRPETWRGGWAHTAIGGTLVVVLAADGAYEMQQSTQTTTGRWRGDATGFTLIPEGGAPLRYRARRDGDALLVSGGDLPSEVRFHRWDPDRYNPPPTVSGGVP